VDRHPGALRLIRKNLEACSLLDRARLIRWDISRNLACLETLAGSLDLAFLDPPYGAGLPAPALLHLRRSEAMRAGALVVVEHDPSESLGELGGWASTVDRRRYGRTLVSFLEVL
jgi:16S rRNA (guanine966-N2)-methyltransferase